MQQPQKFIFRYKIFSFKSTMTDGEMYLIHTYELWE